MAIALYRKYRPQTFAAVTGQHHVVLTLQNQVKTGSVAHAYLFTGPRGVGKTTTARLLARIINCLGRKEDEVEPCGTCTSCVAITEGRAFDVIEIDAASNTGVDNVREAILETVRFAPVECKKKVFIIDEVHMLSTAAFNALLKTLEEPPPYVVFVLATTEIQKVPATILSRCQRFDFHLVGVADLIKRLSDLAQGEGRTVDAEVFDAIAHVAGGSLRDAESLFGQILSIGEGDVTMDIASLVLPRIAYATIIEYIDALVRKDASGAFVACAHAIEQGVDPTQFADDIVQITRMMLAITLEQSADAASGVFVPEMREKIVALGKQTTARRCAEILDRMLRAREETKRLDAGMLPLEIAGVELATEELSFTKVTESKPPSSSAPQQGGTPTSAEASVGRSEDKPSQFRAPDASTPVQPMTKPLVEKSVIATAGTNPPPTVGRAVKTTIKECKMQWQEFIRTVAEISPSLPFILNVSEPLRIDEGALVIGARYPFHRDRLNEEKQFRAMVQACEKVFGESFPIRAEVAELAAAPNADVEALPTSPAFADPGLNAVLAALGGTVVDGGQATT